MRHTNCFQQGNGDITDIADISKFFPAGIDPRVWKRADDAPGRRCLRGAVALEMIFLTRNQKPHFGDPDLAICALDRTLDEEETLAVCVLPDRICWMVKAWPGVGSMRSALAQIAGYAEIYGAPAGRVWQRGFWYRPVASEEDVVAQGAAIAGLPWDEGLYEMSSSGASRQMVSRVWIAHALRRADFRSIDNERVSRRVPRLDSIS